MSAPLAITLHASAAEVASGSGTAVDLWGTDSVETRRVAELRLVVSAITGTNASITITIQTSLDGTSWRAADTFAAVTAVTAAGGVEYATGDLDRYVRVSWALSAGAAATFLLTGTALETWCSLSQLASLGAAAAAVGALPKATRIRHLSAATQVAAGYICRRYQAPIIRVGADVAQAVAKIASLSLLTDVQGVSPHTDATALALEECRAKTNWLRDVSRGIAGADVTDSTPTTTEGTGVVVTGTSRGWGSMSVV